MAITRIHAIKATVSGAVNYICNEKKTDSSLLISSFGTTPETSANDFKFTLSHTDSSDPNKAFHLIQSFAPGEVSAEEAHKIGEELADRLLKGRYSYIVATHTDKGHIHLLVNCSPQHYIPDMIKALKGVSARLLMKEFGEELKRKLWGGHLWNPSYFVATVSENTEEQIRKYIQNQKRK